MKLREFLTVFEQSDRLRIVKNEKDVYTGFLALMSHAGNMEALMEAEVKRFRPTPEIRHKEWQKTWAYGTVATAGNAGIFLFRFADEPI